jgi:SMODS and SLOG-associating 2TM effector domain 2
MLGSAKDVPVPDNLSELDWSERNRGESIAALKAYVTRRANDAVAYYQYAKKPKKQWAIWLRMGSLIFAGLAGIIPIVSQLFAREDGSPVIQPAWASIALALAAGSLAIDRFFGYSTAWMRFMASELKVRRALDAFELEWEASRSSWSGREPSDEQVQEMIGRANRFLATIGDIVREETEQWMTEFREAMRQLDERAKAAAALDRRGGVRVYVTNGDLAPEGWDLSVDDGPPRSHRGRTAALTSLLPGIHVIRVRGKLAGSPAQGEGAVAVAEGGIADVELTLN